MRKNLVKAKIRAGQPSFGIGGSPFLSPDLVEFFGYVGFEWLFIDLEHYPVDLETLANITRASELAGIVPFARIPKTHDQELILRYLETGMMGIITSFSNCREDIEFAVRAVKYPPLGTRSAGLMRAARWGLGQPAPEYYEATNRETMVIALVEEKAGIENLDEILSVEGLDVACIAPADLSLTLGYPDQLDHPEVAELLKHGREKILASDKALMITVQDGDAARRWVEAGALMVRVKAQGLLASAAEAWLKKVRG